MVFLVLLHSCYVYLGVTGAMDCKRVFKIQVNVVIGAFWQVLRVL